MECLYGGKDAPTNDEYDNYGCECEGQWLRLSLTSDFDQKSLQTSGNPFDENDVPDADQRGCRGNRDPVGFVKVFPHRAKSSTRSSLVAPRWLKTAAACPATPIAQAGVQQPLL